MSSVKPEITSDQVFEIAEKHFGSRVCELAPIAQGLIARTFSFRVDGTGYIIRFHTDNMLAHFEKERFVWEHHGAPAIPIPPIVHIGQLEQLHYAISIKVPGRTLDHISPEEYRQALPSVIETLCAIHQADVSSSSNYGLFDGSGTGITPSWRSSLSSIHDEDPEWDFYGKWHVLFDTTFLERDLFEHVYQRMIDLLDYCPEERYLVHGGYGFGNVLVHQGQVTGVVDWMDARYGDFVYDIVWLDYFYPDPNHQQFAYDYYTRRGFSFPDFRERLLCYMCYMALDGLRFFAKVGNAESYKWVRERILALLSSGVNP